MLDSTLQDFDLLVSPGTLGFYRSCEITTVFIKDKSGGSVRNVYTICVFEETKLKQTSPRFLTPKLFSLNKKSSMGIIQHYESLRNSRLKCLNLVNFGIWKYEDTTLELPSLKRLPKQFVPAMGSTPLNSILKNNFDNGSYLIEFFAEDKRKLDFILSNVSVLNKMSEEIREYIPIDLAFIKDRIGNVIFQFPINIVAVKERTNPDRDSVIVDVAWHQKLKRKPECEIITQSGMDSLTTGFAHSHVIGDTEKAIKSGSTDAQVTTMLFDKKNSLILHFFRGGFIGGFNLAARSVNPEKRRINLPQDSGSAPEAVELEVAWRVTDASQDTFLDYQQHVRSRIYDAERERLTRERTFLQYGKGENERSKALDDIKALIEVHGDEGVRLWDPYLSAKDLIQTLFFSKVAGASLKAIGSKKVTDLAEVESGWHTWVDDQQKVLNGSGNLLGINLEFRCKYNDYGWNFHDRFLIFPRKREPLAWSLGTSVNALGKEHHILQKVANAQNILNAFDDLWSALDSADCLVWKYP